LQRRTIIKRAALIILASVVTMALLAALTWCGMLYHNHGSLGVRCGLLATSGDQFLDGSRRVFQKCSWHLGDGTRTWGETYGVKVSRLYLTVEVKHTNPRVTPAEAKE
jgi:hypothetical protein